MRGSKLLCQYCKVEVVTTYVEEVNRDGYGRLSCEQVPAVKCPQCRKTKKASFAISEYDGKPSQHALEVVVGKDFPSWLGWQIDRGNEIGFLAGELAEDHVSLPQNASYKETQGYWEKNTEEWCLRHRGLSFEPEEALAAAWIAWALEETTSWEVAAQEVVALCPWVLRGITTKVKKPRKPHYELIKCVIGMNPETS